jgi:hypothetical protein
LRLQDKERDRCDDELEDYREKEERDDFAAADVTGKERIKYQRGRKYVVHQTADGFGRYIELSSSPPTNGGNTQDGNDVVNKNSK